MFGIFRKQKPLDDETLLVRTIASMLNEDGWQMMRIGEVTTLTKNAFTVTHIPDKEIVTITSGETFVSLPDNTPIPYSLVKNLFSENRCILLHDVVRTRIARTEAFAISHFATTIGRKLNGDEKEYSNIDLADSLCVAADKTKWKRGTGGLITCGEVSLAIKGWHVVATWEGVSVYFDKFIHPDLFRTFEKLAEDFAREEQAERENAVKFLLKKLMA